MFGPLIKAMEVVKQEMATVNIDILGIRKLKWTGMGEFKSDDHCIYYCRSKANRVLPKEDTGHSQHPLPTTQEKTTHVHHQMINTEI